jgi:hypothetical protein
MLYVLSEMIQQLNAPIYTAVLKVFINIKN